MLPLATRIQVQDDTAERRRTRRHPLGLAVEHGGRAVVENLSETGLALQTDARLAVGDSFEIELPLSGAVVAVVAWAEDGVLGCEFATPISRAAVSAARLRSPFDAPEASVAAAQGGASLALPQPEPRYAVAMGVMAAFTAVAAMFVAAMLTAPFAGS